MKKQIYLAAASIAALSLVAACGKKAGETDMNPGQSQPVNAVQDHTAAAVGVTSAETLGATTDGFVTAAAISDMYELEAAKIALAKSKSPAVKKFAQMMVTDHTASTAKLKALLPTSGANVTPPAAMDERRKGMIDNLKAANAADFDKVYLDQQTAAHREASLLFGTYSDRGDNAALKGFAAELKPKIDGHLKMAEDLDRTGADATRPGASKPGDQTH